MRQRSRIKITSIEMAMKQIKTAVDWLPTKTFFKDITVTLVSAAHNLQEMAQVVNANATLLDALVKHTKYEAPNEEDKNIPNDKTTQIKDKKE